MSSKKQLVSLLAWATRSNDPVIPQSASAWIAVYEGALGYSGSGSDEERASSVLSSLQLDSELMVESLLGNQEGDGFEVPIKVLSTAAQVILGLEGVDKGLQQYLPNGVDLGDLCAVVLSCIEEITALKLSASDSPMVRQVLRVLLRVELICELHETNPLIMSIQKALLLRCLTRPPLVRLTAGTMVPHPSPLTPEQKQDSLRLLNVTRAQFASLDVAYKQETFLLNDALAKLQDKLQEAESIPTDVVRLRETLAASEARTTQLQKRHAEDVKKISALRSQSVANVLFNNAAQHDSSFEFGVENSELDHPEHKARMCGFRRWIYLPMIVVVSTLGCFTGSYFWFASLDPVQKSLPYLSNMIAHQPVSCFGAFFLAVLSIIVAAIMSIRYRLNDDALDHYSIDNLFAGRKAHILNKVTWWIGLVSALGMLGIGCFQYVLKDAAGGFSALQYVHLTFVLLCFGGACLHFTLSLVIDFHLRRVAWLRRSRLACVLLVWISAAGTAVFMMLYRVTAEPWVHTTGAMFEFVTVGLFLVNILTFSYELSGSRVMFDARPGKLLSLDENTSLLSAPGGLAAGDHGHSH